MRYMRGLLGLAMFLGATVGFSQNLEVKEPVTQIGLSKTLHYLDLFIKTDHSSTRLSAEVNPFIKKLEAKKASFKSDKAFLHYLFYKTHHKLLKQYVEYCPFDAFLKDGTYNCLTGTALFSILLTHFNIDYKIIETNYHIFLIAHTTKGNVLFEATDALSGFVDSDTEIQARINTYKENQLAKTKGDKSYYQYGFKIYNTVSMEQLLGLMYFNLAIDAYNKRDLLMSVNYLYQSANLYQSPRIEDFSRIILLTADEQDLVKIENEGSLKKLQFIQKKIPGLTSANSLEPR